MKIINGWKFRERLRALMSEYDHGNGINQKQLQDQTGISRKTINQYLNAKSIPRNDCLQILAQFFHVYPEYLSGKSNYKDVGDMIDKKVSAEERETLARHVKMLYYFDKEFGLDDYEHGEMTVLSSHMETETVDGEEIEVPCIDDFEDDYTRLLKDIEGYVTFKTKQFKDTHAKEKPVKHVKKARGNK